MSLLQKKKRDLLKKQTRVKQNYKNTQERTLNKHKKAVALIAGVFSLIGISTSPHPFLLGVSYVVHEAGHIIATRICKGKIRKISVGAFKLAIGYDMYSLSYKKEFIVTISGILSNLAFAFIAFLFNKSSNDYLSFLVACNISLALVNLYPVSVLDGGRILKIALLLFFSPQKAEKISNGVSFFCAIFLWLGSVYLQLVFNANISMLFISVYLLIQLCFSI